MIAIISEEDFLVSGLEIFYPQLIFPTTLGEIFIKWEPNYTRLLLKTSLAPQCPRNKFDTKHSRSFILPQVTYTESLFITQFPISTSLLLPLPSIHNQLIIISWTWNIHFYLYNFESPKLHGFLAHKTFINGLVCIYILGSNLAVTFF